MRPKVTVFVPITRTGDILEKFLAGLDQLQVFPEVTELVFYVDSNDEQLYDRVRAWGIDRVPKKFCSFNIGMSGNDVPTDVNVAYRRNRIAAMKENSKDYINGEIVFGLEDDTLVPPDAFLKLYAILDDDVAYVEGVEMNRWGVPCVGVWRVDDVHEPTRIMTMPFRADGQQDIDGGGFFCYLTLAHLYKAATYHWHDECFGPDVCYGLDLRKQGYKCVVDWSVRCTHLMPNDRVMEVGPHAQVAGWELKSDGWVRTPDWESSQWNLKQK